MCMLGASRVFMVPGEDEESRFMEFYQNFGNKVDYLDKMGQVLHPQSLLDGFRIAIEDTDLIELDFVGGNFTWVRSRCWPNWVEERFDRAFANEGSMVEQVSVVQASSLSHILKNDEGVVTSDHYEMCDLVKRYFLNVFDGSSETRQLESRSTDPSISDARNESLTADLSFEEFTVAVKQMHSDKASVCFNGTYVGPIPLKRGLRQGDPLSPSLFLFCVEGLSFTLKDATENETVNALLANYEFMSGQAINYQKSDIEQVQKNKKAMNILFNGVDGDMFDNIINCKSAKDVWDTVQVLCDGTKQVRENKIELLIQQYEHFNSEESESLTEIFNRFQKLLNALKLHGRVYQTKDSNLKFLRYLPKEWKPMTVSLRNTQDCKEFTLDILYGILKIYELEIEQDENLEKGRNKGGSIALVSEQEKEKETKENDWAADGLEEDDDTSYVNLALMAKSEETEVSSSSNQEWKSSIDVHAQITKVQGIESFSDESWKKSKEKLDSNLVEALSTDVDLTDDERYPSNDQKKYSSKDKEPHPLSESKPVSKSKLAKLNEKYGSVS
ncbi:hypothetical protein AgCh_000644 [Apium graveolens]